MQPDAVLGVGVIEDGDAVAIGDFNDLAVRVSPKVGAQTTTRTLNVSTEIARRMSLSLGSGI